MKTKGRRQSANIRRLGGWTAKEGAKAILRMYKEKVSPEMRTEMQEMFADDVRKSQDLRRGAFVKNFVGAPR